MKQYRYILKYNTSVLAVSLLWNFRCFLSCKRKTNSGCLCRGCETGRGEQIGHDVWEAATGSRVSVWRARGGAGARVLVWHAWGGAGTRVLVWRAWGGAGTSTSGTQGSWHGGHRLSVTTGFPHLMPWLTSVLGCCYTTFIWEYFFFLD